MDRNIFLLSLSRFLRSFVLLVLSVSAPYYLLHFNLSYLDIGLVLFAASAASTMAIYFYPRLGLGGREIVFIYSGIFAIAIFVMLVFQNLAAFILALIFGGISLSGKDSTPNQPLEQFSIGHSIEDQQKKNKAYVFYNFMSYAGNMGGALFLLLESSVNFSLIFEVCFTVAILAMVPYFFAFFPEMRKKTQPMTLEPETRKITRELSVLFGMDAFAGGLVATSILSLWFNIEYSTTLAYNGLIFFLVSIISAVSIFYSGSISAKIGLVKTMVFTHLISNGFLILIPVIHSLLYSEAFLFMRQATSQMDVSPRDSFINTVINRDARVKTNSIFLASRNSAMIPSPAAGGALIDIAPASLLYTAGIIKAAYDIAFYLRFKKYRF